MSVVFATLVDPQWATGVALFLGCIPFGILWIQKLGYFLDIYGGALWFVYVCFIMFYPLFISTISATSVCQLLIHHWQLQIPWNPRDFLVLSSSLIIFQCQNRMVETAWSHRGPKPRPVQQAGTFRQDQTRGYHGKITADGFGNPRKIRRKMGKLWENKSENGGLMGCYDDLAASKPMEHHH